MDFIPNMFAFTVDIYLHQAKSPANVYFKVVLTNDGRIRYIKSLKASVASSILCQYWIDCKLAIINEGLYMHASYYDSCGSQQIQITNFTMNIVSDITNATKYITNHIIISETGNNNRQHEQVIMESLIDRDQGR